MTALRSLRVAMAAMLLTVPSLAAQAQSPLLDALAAGPVVSPTRLVLEPDDRAGSFLVANTGTVPVTYRVMLTDQRMLEDGTFEPIEDPRPGELTLTAHELVVFSPRQFTLEPNQVQVVRILVRRPAGLAFGEYRSHMVFAAIPPADLGQTLEAATQTSGIAIQLIPIKGVAVPVIVRHGALSGSVDIADLAIERDAGDVPVLEVRLNRAGTQSVYGDFEVVYRPQAGPAVPIGILRGVALYTPNAARTVRIPLQPPAGGFGPGTVDVRYLDRSGADGTELASGSVTIR